MPKFCRDCKFIAVPTPGAFDLAKCHHEKAVRISIDYMVSGKKPAEPEYFYASSMRQGTCGEEGKLWTAK
jgi:hypothetical protein